MTIMYKNQLLCIITNYVNKSLHIHTMLMRCVEQQTILAKVSGFICLLSLSSYTLIRNSIFCFTWNSHSYFETIKCNAIRSAKAWIKKSPSGCLWQGQAGPPTGRGSSSQTPGEQKYNLWLFWLSDCTLGKSVAMVCSSRPYRRSEQTATHSSPVIATFGDKSF